MQRSGFGLIALLAFTAALLGGCSSTPSRAPSKPADATVWTKPSPRVAASDADGPPLEAPPDPSLVPDAQPKVEPIRQGGPNKPYEVAGESYTPLTADLPLLESGLASWYGRKFHGRRTASGEVYNMFAMTAAHKTMPIPSYAKVRNPANGREVIVRINDRGPFAAGRIIDLSYSAAGRLGLLGGVAPVEVSRLTHDDIRAMGGGTASSTLLAKADPVPVPVPSPQAKPMVQRPPTAGEVPGNAPAKDRALTEAASGFWLQLGAFGRADGAYGFQNKAAETAAWLAPLMTVFSDGRLHRLQAGPFPSREEAQEMAQKIRAALQLVPVIVERR